MIVKVDYLLLWILSFGGSMSILTCNGVWFNVTCYAKWSSGYGQYL